MTSEDAIGPPTPKMLQVFIWGIRDSYFMLQNAPESKIGVVLFGIGTTLLFTSMPESCFICYVRE
jgi:hypothetical protein